MSKTITISDEAAAFLLEFNRRLETQDNRATANPYYFTVRCMRELAAPEGMTGETRYYSADDTECYTEEELIQHCKECEKDPEEFKEKCEVYDAQEVAEHINVFFTEEGYNEHIKLNGHNYRHFKKYYSYVEHAFRNPEIDKLLSSVKEIGKSLKES